MKFSPRYTVVVPAFREGGIIGSSLRLLSAELKKNKQLFEQLEVIVVAADGGDDTVEIARQHVADFKSLRIIEPGMKVGKGRDVREGVLAAKGDYVLFTDADMATHPKYIRAAFQELQDGADVVIGVRPLAKIHNTLLRRLRSVCSNALIRVMAVPGVHDTQCGFKGFRLDAARTLFAPLETLGWGFDIEVLARARVKKFTIRQLSIPDWYDPKIGKQGLAGESDLHANIRTLAELLRITKRRLTGAYK